MFLLTYAYIPRLIVERKFKLNRYSVIRNKYDIIDGFTFSKFNINLCIIVMQLKTFQ